MANFYGTARSNYDSWWEEIEMLAINIDKCPAHFKE